MLKYVETGRTVGGIRKADFFCSVCIGDVKLEKVRCNITKFGSVFTMSSPSEPWLVMLRCPQCGILYAIDGYKCDNR
jgi:hypothetical protein